MTDPHNFDNLRRNAARRVAQRGMRAHRDILELTYRPGGAHFFPAAYIAMLDRSYMTGEGYLKEIADLIAGSVNITALPTIGLFTAAADMADDFLEDKIVARDFARFQMRAAAAMDSVQRNFPYYIWSYVQGHGAPVLPPLVADTLSLNRLATWMQRRTADDGYVIGLSPQGRDLLRGMVRDEVKQSFQRFGAPSPG
ncbi:MAG: hypothetical protein P4M15_12275 [Alphaproteobacteria bacterium]|nr:hypothetical protein [Alphaproteobacteria bacterium]